jgi:hypothetical protein
MSRLPPDRQFIDRNIQVSMANIGKPTLNAFAARLMRTLKEEEVSLHH